MRRTFKTNPYLLALMVLSNILLVGCSGFSGIRAPLYDGQPVEPNVEAIETYENSREITGEEKAYYIRYPFSEAIYEASLSYTDAEPVLLTEGNYIIGQDLPAGRVSLLSNESVFTRENNAVHVGNLMIRDQADAVYFENLFHSGYGQLVAQVDLIRGHTIEVIGEGAEITVFYSENIPDDPYVLMDPPELLVNLERLEVTQPIITNEQKQSVTLTAGIYEVGEQIEPGIYEIRTVQAPHNTEMFHFRAGAEIRVYELITNESSEEALGEEQVEPTQNYPTIELVEGDKIYPNLIQALELVKID